MRKKLRALIICIQRNRYYRKIFRSLLLGNIIFEMRREGEEDYYFSARKRENVIASLYLSRLHDECRDGWLIISLRINRFYRHLGIGKKLLAHVTEFASRPHPGGGIYADVLTEYQDIIKFYEDSGFSVEPESKRHDNNIELTPMSKKVD